MEIKKIFIVIFIVLMIIIGILIVVLNSKQNIDSDAAVSVELTEDDKKAMKKVEDQAIKEKLAKLSESKRVEYYATQFVKALENKQYKAAYGMLNNDFKKNYFATQESFEEYAKKYIPKNIGVDYKNIERLGQIYVMEIDVTDVLTKVNPNNYSCYFVIKENDYNDYELSFSVDSAMKNSNTEDTEE